MSPVENSNLPPNRAAPVDHSLLHNPPTNNGHDPFSEQNSQQFPALEYPSASSGLDPSSGYLHPQPQLHQNPLDMMNGGNQQYPQMFPSSTDSGGAGGMPVPSHLMNGRGGHSNNGGMPGSNPHEMPNHGKKKEF